LLLEQALLEDHGRQRELREKKEREKREKDLRRLADLEAARSEDSKRPGYQRLRAQQVRVCG
jgi:kinesin family protein 4/21/27